MMTAQSQSLVEQPFALYPMGTNPAFAGASRCDYGAGRRFVVNHSRPLIQNQGEFQNSLVAWDELVPGLFGSSLGITIQNWGCNYYRGNTISGIYSYLIRPGRHTHLKFAAEGSLNHSLFKPKEFIKIPAIHPGIDLSKLGSLEDQKIDLWNLNIGALLNGKSYTVGLSLSNVFRHDTLVWHHLSPGFSRIISLQGSYTIRISKSKSIQRNYLTPIIRLAMAGTTYNTDIGALFRSRRMMFGLFSKINSDRYRNGITTIVGCRISWPVHLYYFGDIRFNPGGKSAYFSHGIIAVLKLCIPPGPRPLNLPQGAEFGGDYEDIKLHYDYF